MRLSEAMRLGAMALPPIYGPVFQREYGRDGLRICGACAVGTVLYAAAGIEGVRRMDDADGPTEFIADFIEARWPWTRDWREHHADCPIGNRLITLFESDHWSREQIADWIEAQELEAERQQALTDSTDHKCGTTDCEQPVLSTRET